MWSEGKRRMWGTKVRAVRLGVWVGVRGCGWGWVGVGWGVCVRMWLRPEDQTKISHGETRACTQVGQSGCELR